MTHARVLAVEAPVQGRSEDPMFSTFTFAHIALTFPKTRGCMARTSSATGAKRPGGSNNICRKPHTLSFWPWSESRLLLLTSLIYSSRKSCLQFETSLFETLNPKLPKEPLTICMGARRFDQASWQIPGKTNSGFPSSKSLPGAGPCQGLPRTFAKLPRLSKLLDKLAEAFNP